MALRAKGEQWRQRVYDDIPQRMAKQTRALTKALEASNSRFFRNIWQNRLKKASSGYEPLKDEYAHQKFRYYANLKNKDGSANVAASAIADTGPSAIQTTTFYSFKHHLRSQLLRRDANKDLGKPKVTYRTINKKNAPPVLRLTVERFSLLSGLSGEGMIDAIYNQHSGDRFWAKMITLDRGRRGKRPIVARPLLTPALKYALGRGLTDEIKKWSKK